MAAKRASVGTTDNTGSDKKHKPAAGTEVNGESAPGSGGAAAASGAAETPNARGDDTNTHARPKKQTVLMIDSVQPFRPQLPSMEDIVSGKAPSVRSYAHNLFRYVSYKFASFLYDDELIELRHPLEESRCPPIENTPKHTASHLWRPTSIMEPLDMTRCMWSLTHSGFYDGTVSIWNLVRWRLRMHHGILRTTFYMSPRDAPLEFGSLAAADVRRLRLLWEVSNQVTVRLRLKPTAHQLVLDRLNMADQLRIKALGSGVQSFFQFCCDVFTLPKTDEPQLSCVKLVALLEEFGVTYKGKAIDKPMGFALLAVMPFALDPQCRETVAFLDRIEPKAFDDPTRVMRCCQRVKNSSATAEHLDSFVFAMESMAVSLLAGNTKDPSVFTVQNLVGQAKGEPGFVKTHVMKKRMCTWFLDQVSAEISSAASGAETSVTTEGYQKLRTWFQSPHKFFQKFARARTAAEQEQCSLRTLISHNLATFEKGLAGAAEAAAMEFLTLILVFEGDGEARDLAVSSRSYASYFENAGADESEDEYDGDSRLLGAYRSFKKTLREAPVGADSKDSDDGGFNFIETEGDEDSEVKAKIYQKVVSSRKDMQKFIPLRNWEKKPWAEGQEATAIFQKSTFAASGANEAGKQHKLMLFCPELFQTKEPFASATAYKDKVVWRSEMGEVLEWMLSKADENTIVAATDGRNPKIRFHLEKIVFEKERDEQKHLETHILFKGHPPKGDLRFQSRKVYGGLDNVETVVGVLPVSRVRMRTRARLNFSACGEKTTHTRSYSGVPWRPLSGLPRMLPNVKEGVTGITLPAFDKVVEAETRVRGQPLFWKEMLDVEFWLAFFRDTYTTHVFDTSPGSTAAACAAAILDIHYEGVAMSQKHATWLDNIMDRAIFAAIHLRSIPVDDKGQKDPEAKALHDNVMAFFKDLVEEGRKYVERDGGRGGGEGEISTEPEDSGDDDA